MDRGPTDPRHMVTVNVVVLAGTVAADPDYRRFVAWRTGRFGSEIASSGSDLR
ncbi:MAG: hypothetical protein ABWY83_01620 [Actinomycetota bacterium]